jgi:hypothetical protein
LLDESSVVLARLVAVADEVGAALERSSFTRFGLAVLGR